MNKIIILFILIFSLSFCFISCNSIKYNDALELIEKGEYVAAYEILDELGDYKDAQQKIASFRYVLVMATACNSDGETEYAEIFYNEDNLPIQEVCTYSNGNKSISDYTYDANGNMIKKVSTDYDGDKYIYDYTYDANGNMIKVVSTDYDGYIESIDVEYKLVYIPYKVTEQIEEIINLD